MRAVAVALEARLSHVVAWILPVLLTACGGQSSPTQPSAAGALSATVILLEGEPGSGDGHVVQRSRASSGQTIHLGPGERRRWTFAVSAEQAKYALSVTYSNGKEGENEHLTVTVDGATVSSFQDRDSGDSTEGWNLFVTDPAGTSTLRAGNHTLVLEVSGGDGCVEIDIMTLSPTSAG
jgi:hypothetical protein